MTPIYPLTVPATTHCPNFPLTGPEINHCPENGHIMKCSPLAVRSPTSSGNGTCATTEPPKQATYKSPHLHSSRIPRTLSRLLPHNRPDSNKSTALIQPSLLAWERLDVEITALTCRINSNNNNTYWLSGSSWHPAGRQK